MGERSLSTLKKRAFKNEQAVRTNSQRKAAENSLLIDELNSLRREKKILEMKMGHMQTTLHKLRSQLQRGGSAELPEIVSAPESRPSTGQRVSSGTSGANTPATGSR